MVKWGHRSGSVGLVDQEMRLSFRPDVIRLRTNVLDPKIEPEADFSHSTQ